MELNEKEKKAFESFNSFQAFKRLLLSETIWISKETFRLKQACTYLKEFERKMLNAANDNEIERYYDIWENVNRLEAYKREYLQ
jgi:hypothetical protein